MELTRQKLEEALNAELVGKDVGYSHWNFTGVLLKALRILVKDAGLNETDFSYKVQSTNSVYLTYKGVSFGEAAFQKQKGKYKYGGYEWTFKKVFVCLWNEDIGYSSYKGLTFLEMINKIDEDLDIKKNKEQAKLEQAKQIFQKIKEEIGAKDDYEVRSFIEYLNKSKYSISQ